MQRQELARILGLLDTDQRIHKLAEDVSENCGDLAKASETSSWLQSELDKCKKTDPFRKSPFLFFILAYATYFTGNNPASIKFVQRATTQFHRQGIEQKWNEALCNWFLGLLEYEEKLYEDARKAIEESINAFMDIRDDCYHKTGQLDNSILLIIGAIKNSYFRVYTQVSLKTPTVEETNIPIDLFHWIINQILISDSDESLMKLWQRVKEADPTTALYLVNEIKDIIDSKPSIESTSSTCHDILLSHCCNLVFYAREKDYEHVLDSALRLTNETDRTDKYNQSLFHWYQSLILYNKSEVKMGLSELNRSSQLLDELIYEYQDEDINYSNVLQNLKTEVEMWRYYFTIDKKPLSASSNAKKDAIDNHWRVIIPPKAQRLNIPISLGSSAPAYTRMKRNESTVKSFNNIKHEAFPRQPKSTPRQPLTHVTSSSPSSEVNKSKTFHITIPVDIQALANSNSNSAMAHLSNQQYSQLRNYNVNIALQAKYGKTFENTITSKRVVLPARPVYGSVTAGTDGWPALPSIDDLELWASEVDENYQMSVGGKDYRVYSVRENDKQLPAFVEERIYGWFQVEGDSMNVATPQPICKQDYVLFFEQRNLDACKKRIVIAAPSLSTPRLMVKRLNKEGEQYILDSESTQEINGVRINSHQHIIGEVIAVAKLIR